MLGDRAVGSDRRVPAERAQRCTGHEVRVEIRRASPDTLAVKEALRLLGR